MVLEDRNRILKMYDELLAAVSQLPNIDSISDDGHNEHGNVAQDTEDRVLARGLEAVLGQWEMAKFQRRAAHLGTPIYLRC